MNEYTQQPERNISIEKFSWTEKKNIPKWNICLAVNKNATIESL